jgi:hypothetical protein
MSVKYVCDESRSVVRFTTLQASSTQFMCFHRLLGVPRTAPETALNSNQ